MVTKDCLRQDPEPQWTEQSWLTRLERNFSRKGRAGSARLGETRVAEEKQSGIVARLCLRSESHSSQVSRRKHLAAQLSLPSLASTNFPSCRAKSLRKTPYF